MRQNEREMSEEIRSHEVRTSIMSIIGATELLNAEYKEHQNKHEINLYKKFILTLFSKIQKGWKKQLIQNKGLIRYNSVIGVICRVNKIW